MKSQSSNDKEWLLSQRKITAAERALILSSLVRPWCKFMNSVRSNSALFLSFFRFRIWKKRKMRRRIQTVLSFECLNCKGWLFTMPDDYYRHQKFHICLPGRKSRYNSKCITNEKIIIEFSLKAWKFLFFVCRLYLELSRADFGLIRVQV